MTKENSFTICSICKSSDIEILGEYRNIHPAFDNLKRGRCKSCDMIFATPMPSNELMAKFNSTYFQSAHGGLSGSKESLAFFRAIGKIRGKYLEEFLKINGINAASILEIGPGHGFFAENWLLNNSGISYIGLESDESCYPSLLRIGVEVLNPLSDLPITDVVVISHVLEHVTDPIAFLKKVTEGLRPGGVLFIEVPCKDCEYKPLDEPHLLFFDKFPMKILLERVGFFDIKLSYHGQQIEKLKNETFFSKKWRSLRSRLINMGIIAPFSFNKRKMEFIENSLERAVVAPYKAHLDSEQPSWWLRAVALKNNL
jgi:SAM-dependent methyltransferase